MQKILFDVILLKSLLNDFIRVLDTFNLNQVQEELIGMNPVFPLVDAREGCRGIEIQSNESMESWKESLFTTGRNLMEEFSSQVSWRFENLDYIEKWIELVHPSKFDEQRASVQEQKACCEVSIFRSRRHHWGFLLVPVLLTCYIHALYCKVKF